LVKYRFSLKKGGTGYAACILGAVWQFSNSYTPCIHHQK
jgi:hypothetical protein